MRLESFEDESTMQAVRSVYPPLDRGRRQRLRTQLLQQAGLTERAGARAVSRPAAPHHSVWPAVGHRGKMLVAAVLLASSALGVGATGVGSAAVSAAIAHLPFLQPDRPMGAGFTAHAPYTFIEQPPADGMVSKEAAIAEALRHASVAPAGQLLPDVTVEARFGLYADQAFKTRPVWLVTFSGPGVNIPINDGPGPRPGENPVAAPTAHTDVVVIDGATGSYLEEEMVGGQ